MKILLVHNSYQQPGGEDIVFDQERQMLERAGHIVITYRRSNSEVAAYSGLEQLALARKSHLVYRHTTTIRQIAGAREARSGTRPQHVRHGVTVNLFSLSVKPMCL